VDTVRCYNCGSYCGEIYDTQWFLLDAENYCALQCYKDQRIKEENERPEEKSSPGPRNGRTKKASRKNSRKPKSSKRRV
jgi:hypothetical protein